MNTSPEVDQVAPAWVAALSKLGNIPKTRTAVIPTKAGGSYSYNYADLGAVIDASKPVLAAQDLIVHQYSVQAEQGKVRYVTRVWHTSGQWIEDEGMSMPAPNNPQEVGGSVTYLRRYALVAFLGLATEEDDDGNGAKQSIQGDEAERREIAARFDRAELLVAEIKSLDAAGKDALKAWNESQDTKHGFGVDALATDSVWLEMVENWMDERGTS